MRRPVVLALAAAAVIVGVAVVRPRPAPPARAVEHRGLADIAIVEPEHRDASLDLLLDGLLHGPILKRAQAARAMARLGAGAAPLIPDLIAFLCDERNDQARVRYLVEDVLVAIGEEAAPAALQLMAHPNVEGRQSGILILARVRGEAAVDTLMPLLKDDAVDRHAAGQLAALGTPGRAALVSAITDESVKLDALASAVADSGKPIAAPLAGLLDAPEQATRARAAAMLKELGKNARPAADVIFRTLADPRFGDRLLLIPILPSLRQAPPETLRSVAEILGSAARSEWNVPLLRAVCALASLGPAAHESLPALVVHMGRGGYPAAVAAEAHWRISGDARVAVERLIANIEREPEADDGWRPCANHATWTIVKMGAEAAAAAPTLLRELDRQSGRVRRGYRDALAAIGEAALPALREWLPTATPGAARSLIGLLGDAADEEIFAATGSRPEPADGPDSFEDLAPEDPRLLPELRRRLPNQAILGRTLFAMRRLGESAAPAVPDLIPLLENQGARSSAALTLAAIGRAAAPAVPALERYVEDPRYEGRHAIFEALWRITREERYAELGLRPTAVKAADAWAVPQLLGGLARDDIPWRRHCAEALGRLGPAARAAAPDLARLASDESEDEYVRDAARDALRQIGG
jgi:HEAT repeat protein